MAPPMMDAGSKYCVLIPILERELEGKSEEEKVDIFLFLTAQVEENPYYVHTLYAYKDDRMFRIFLDRLGGDIAKYRSSRRYAVVMQAVWEELEQIERNPVDYSATTMHPMVNNNVLVTAGKSLPSSYLALAVCQLSQISRTQFIHSLERILPVVKRAGLQKVGAVLIAAVLVAEASVAIYQWMCGKMKGKKCAKIVCDAVATTIGGVAGAAAGAAVGSVVPGTGTVIGGIVGGVLGSVMTSYGSGWITQHIFELSPAEALAEAYKFMDIHSYSSNEQVNGRYRELAAQYHPDNGGSKEKWHDLQVAQHIIYVSRNPEHHPE